MVDVRRAPPAEFDALYQMLCQRTGEREEAVVRDWYDTHPELFHGVYADGALVGFTAGRARSDTSVELVGIAVDDAYTRQGVGSRLLDAFESAAAELGYDRVSLGSAGGYVDEFYLANGYEPESILVRLHPEDVPENHVDLGFEILRERVDDGTQKFYVAPGGHDPERVQAVREAFGDPQAIYIVEKYV
ncbi:GNAT family N-acetyltransferase [Halobacterium wangiae]|uniref:GNAT family N-acetyltransferase n=1 Tax=Halobacterium wangiae TaxID=2902623 RepID=UPI001E3DEB36|nr:GNAT family N-acetyltransferase [Halobacterium wangiae]